MPISGPTRFGQGLFWTLEFPCFPPGSRLMSYPIVGTMSDPGKGRHSEPVCRVLSGAMCGSPHVVAHFRKGRSIREEMKGAVLFDLLRRS